MTSHHQNPSICGLIPNYQWLHHPCPLVTHHPHPSAATESWPLVPLYPPISDYIIFIHHWHDYPHLYRWLYHIHTLPPTQTHTCTHQWLHFPIFQRIHYPHPIIGFIIPSPFIGGFIIPIHYWVHYACPSLASSSASTNGFIIPVHFPYLGPSVASSTQSINGLTFPSISAFLISIWSSFPLSNNSIKALIIPIHPWLLHSSVAPSPCINGFILSIHQSLHYLYPSATTVMGSSPGPIVIIFVLPSCPVQSGNSCKKQTSPSGSHTPTSMDSASSHINGSTILTCPWFQHLYTHMVPISIHIHGPSILTHPWFHHPHTSMIPASLHNHSSKIYTHGSSILTHPWFQHPHTSMVPASSHIHDGGHLQLCGQVLYAHHLGCLNNPIFSNLGLSAACWAHSMCHHELWPTSVSHPSSFLIAFRPCWRKTLPENYYCYL